MESKYYIGADIGQGDDFSVIMVTKMSPHGIATVIRAENYDLRRLTEYEKLMKFQAFIKEEQENYPTALTLITQYNK